MSCVKRYFVSLDIRGDMNIGGRSSVSLFRDRHLQSASSQLLDLMQCSCQGVSVVLVRLDIQCSYDDSTVYSRSEGYLATKLIFLVILSFDHIVHMGLMDAVNLVLAVPFLAEDLFA
jgi:hypothetical protein